MEPAPIPPHERRWRHPSELAPTASEVSTKTNPRVLLVASGTTALLLAAVMVVALAPSRSTAPSAISATTLPTASVELQNTTGPLASPGRATDGDQEMVRTLRSTILLDVGVALIGAPHAVSAAPVGDANDFAIASHLPSPTDRVILLTSSYTYVLRWDDIGDIRAPNGSIVVTRDGWLVATFVSDELRLLVN